MIQVNHGVGTLSRSMRRSGTLVGILLVLPCLGFAQEVAQHTAICDEVMELVNAGRLSSTKLPADPGFHIGESESELLRDFNTSIHPLAAADVDGDGVSDRIAMVSGGGSCSSGGAFLLDAALARGHIEKGYVGFNEIEVEADENLRWASWGAEDSIHTIMGQTVVVTAPKKRQPNLVSLLSAEGKVPICAYRRAEGEAVHVRHARDAQLCDSAAKRLLVPVEAGDWVSATPSLREQIGPYDGASVVTLDLDGDGQEERVGMLSHSSGAGCGGEFSWLVVLDSDGTISTGPLNAALNGPEISRHDGRWDALRLFHWNGRIVMAAVRSGEDRLLSVDGSGVHVECEFERFQHVAVEKRYEGARAETVSQ